MANVKGSAILARLRFIRERYGEAQVQRVLRSLAPAHREILDARVLPQDWVPFDLFVDLNVTADEAFGRGDLALCYEMGRYSAEINLPTLYRLFYRLGNPQFIFRKAARLWRVHYDTGSMVPIEEPGVLRLRIEGFEPPHRAHCLSVMGWATKSYELSGGVLGEYAEERCRTRGDPACEMVMRER
jgi:hypothetical protein